jgi:hypothetical protein
MLVSVFDLLAVPLFVGAVVGPLTYLATRWWTEGMGVGVDASVALLAVVITMVGWWVN